MNNAGVEAIDAGGADLHIRVTPQSGPPLSDSEAVGAIPALLAVHWAVQCACQIAELGVPDALGEAPESAGELALRVGADAGALYRVLRFLATYGILEEQRHGYFIHSPISRVLRSDHPQSRRDLLRLGATNVSQGIFANLGHALRTGRPAAEVAYPEGVFNYLARHPDESDIFDRSMTAKSHSEIAAALRVYDFSRFATIADIGGGRGHLLQAVLNQAPQATGVLFDLPHVLGARASSQISGRISAVSGDFFEDPLPVCDAYLLKSVLHDWSDEESIRILKSVRRSAPTGATVLVIEAELPDGPGPHPAKWLDVVMLGWASGRERTAAEFARLFAAADFKFVRVIRASQEVSIFEAAPNRA